MVERSEVDQMAKFMAAMTDTPHESSPDRPTTAGDSAVAEMKVILERFHAAADQVVTEAPFDRELREALTTEAIDGGARIGAWEIHSHQSGQHTVYDVVNTRGERLAIDLLLYEAARGLVRILNDGGRINSREFVELLRAEQEYNSRVGDMVLYKHHLTHHATSPRVAVFEARYSDARQRATLARQRVTKLAEGR